MEGNCLHRKERKHRLIKKGTQVPDLIFLNVVNGSKKEDAKNDSSCLNQHTHAIESCVQECSSALWQWTFSTLHSHQRATSIIHHSFSAQCLSAAG